VRIVVTGAGGQLGAELCRLLGPDAVPLDIDTLDLRNGLAVAKTMDQLRPDAVISCGAYTLVDQAEVEPGQCRAINAAAVGHLAKACGRFDCPLVQISTDYVFSGEPERSTPYREDDLPSPRGVYAQTKLEGERAAAEHPKHLIVRTCGLYARPAHTQARNFVKTILRLARSQPKLRIVGDQWCTPSYVPHVARAILFLLDGGGNGPAPWGIYHVTNRGATTWYEFAREIVWRAGLDVSLEPITTAEYGAAAARPAFSVLDTAAYHRLGGPAMPDWKIALEEYFAELRSLSNPEV
jgi:dTDP-4-dehydrorhamnose reductase